VLSSYVFNSPAPRQLGAVFLALVLLILGGCVHPPAPTTPPVPDLADAKERVARYVDSGEYDRDFAAVVAQARTWLERRAKSGGRLALVLDIDETALSNIPVLKLNDWGVILEGATNLITGPCGLFEWMKLSRAEPLRPTLELTRLARQSGVAILFVTARPERLRAATEQNLKAAGYEWARLFLKPPRPKGAPKPASESEYKSRVRAQCVAEGYTIILNMGDQQSDLAGGFAERTFKLPNPFYRVP
jgi:acid phosphatase